MDENERYVRENWNGVRFGAAPKTACGRVYAKHPVEGAEWILSGNPNANIFEHHHALPEHEAWNRAAKFTRARLEEIADVRAEIDWLLAEYNHHEGTIYAEIPGRLLDAREAHLESLRRGMTRRGEAGK
jgi:hypothetical protein